MTDQPSRPAIACIRSTLARELLSQQMDICRDIAWRHGLEWSRYSRTRHHLAGEETWTGLLAVLSIAQCRGHHVPELTMLSSGDTKILMMIYNALTREGCTIIAANDNPASAMAGIA